MLVLSNRSRMQITDFVTVPMPPSTNSLYRNVPKLGRVKTVEYRAYESRMMEWKLMNQLYCNAISEQVLARTGIELEIRYFFLEGDLFYKNGKMKRIDLDNRLKALIDCVFKCIGLDDNLVQKITATKHVGRESRCEMRITFADRTY